MLTTSKARLLRLHLSEDDHYAGKLLYEAVVARCQELHIAGATVFRGLEGFGETAAIQRRHLVASDRPIVVTIVDTPEKIEQLIPELEAIIGDGLMAVSEVEVIRVERGMASGPA